MSKKDLALDTGELKSVKIDLPRQHRERRNTHHAVGYENSLELKGLPKVSSRSSDFVYVNNAYVGSMSSVNEIRQAPMPPPTSVIREQYWACSKWPFAQRVLAIVVGVLLGTVIGLTLTVAMTGKSDDVISGLFRSSAPD